MLSNNFYLKSSNNDHKNSSKTKINKHTVCGYLLFTQFLFDSTKKKYEYCGGENCMKSFCKDLKVQATKITKCKQKKVILLIGDGKNSIINKILNYICKKKN